MGWNYHGSPPTRGNLERYVFTRRGVGTIPAYAGEPSDQGTALRQVQDHPRLRGGTPCSRNWGVQQTGPSPPRRGNPFQSLILSGLAGTIPAYAGEPE